MKKGKDEIIIELCIHCYQYQHRLCWMLSSILQQVNDPKINVNISFTDNDGDPTTEDVCDFFEEKGLNIYRTHLTEKEIPNRSKGRNAQVKQVIESGRATHMLFADSDHCYHPEFFDNLAIQLSGALKDETRVMGADRKSLKPDYCENYFAEDENEYPCVIPNVVRIVKEWPVWRERGSGVVPGNFQLASVKSIIDHGGVYTKRSRDLWRRTRSDRGFRLQMGGRVGIKTKPQWHLNHSRELGVQR